MQFISSRARLAPWLLVAFLISSCQPVPAYRVVSINGLTMGTTYHIKYAVDARQDVPAADTVQAEVEAIFDRIDKSMSTWREDSDISRFNATLRTDWVPVSADLVEVVAAAERVSERSGGAFDLTVKSLVDVWGFGRDRSEAGVPTRAAIAAARAATGYARLHWRREPPALRKDIPALKIEVAAIAPGFAVDRLSDHLLELGLPSNLVELGGEVRGRGTGPEGRPWRVGIEQANTTGQIDILLELRDEALSTSGSYRNYIKLNGKIYSHQIDPRSAAPVVHETVSVSVVAATATEADAWSTALMVLGSRSGIELGERLGLGARFIDAAGSGVVTKVTRKFPASSRAADAGNGGKNTHVSITMQTSTIHVALDAHNDQQGDGSNDKIEANRSGRRRVDGRRKCPGRGSRSS